MDVLHEVLVCPAIGEPFNVAHAVAALTSLNLSVTSRGGRLNSNLKWGRNIPASCSVTSVLLGRKCVPATVFACNLRPEAARRAAGIPPMVREQVRCGCGSQYEEEDVSDRKRVLVTGLSGAVGSAIRTELEERYELSSLSRYGIEDFAQERNFRGDIADLDAIQPAFEGQHTVVHLAADRRAVAGWASILRSNVIGTYNVFEAARRAGVQRVVVGSSNLAMGGYYLDPPYSYIVSGQFDKVTRPYPLIDEDTQIRPLGYYGVSKAYGEALGSFYKDFHGLSAIHLRIGYTMTTDNPTSLPASLALWLSNRDTAQVHVRAIDAPESLRYAVLNATSDNHWKIFSLERARDLIGYEPQDDAGETVTGNPLSERDSTEYRLHPSGGEDEAPDEAVLARVYELFTTE